MPAIPFDQRPRPASKRLPPWVRRPPLIVEIAGWLVIALCMAGGRWWVADHLPTYVWTRDSGSYLAPATAWIENGQWVTSPRRGPVYSLFLAAVLKLGGTLATVATVQSILGLGTALLTVALARAWLGRAAFWPLWLCALFYALYGLPIELERLIRNETLLTLFATTAFGGWFCALKTGRGTWFAVSGLASGLMQLLKGIFPVFPLIVLALTLWNWRHIPRRGLWLGACYLFLFLLPLVSSKLYTHLSGTTRPPEPEDGQMFYGRTAQWTYLDGGIAPDLKVRVRDQVADYADRFRQTGELDNNEIVKRTVIPSLKQILVNERGGTLTDVNRLCWRLGLEAVAHHPGAYLKQFSRDLYYLNFITAQRFETFQPKQLRTSYNDAAAYCDLHAGDETAALNARIFDLPGARRAVDASVIVPSGISRYSRFMLAMRHVRFLSPVFLTTLLLPCLGWFTRGRERLFWLGNAALWFYYLLLLATVGRPLDRYLMPVVPLMFWTISTALAMAWRRGKRTGFRPAAFVRG